MMTNRIFRNQDEAIDYFFNGGYEEMDNLEQVEFLVSECGYTEQGAFYLVYNTPCI